MLFSLFSPIAIAGIVVAIIISFFPFYKKTSNYTNYIISLMLGLCIFLWALYNNYVLLPALTFIIPLVYFNDKNLDNNIFNQLENIILCLFMLIGAYQIIYSTNLISFYVGLELQSISFYILMSLYNDKKEKISDNIKYFILSSIFSAITLLGISYIYGAFGVVDFKRLIYLSPLMPKHTIMLGALGGIFIIFGAFFKLAIAPFHLWISDIYSSLSYRIIAIIAIMPKIAFVVILTKIINIFSSSRYGVFLESVTISASVCSIFIGSIVMINQKNIKRFLAYSTIAQISYAVLTTVSVGSIVIFGVKISSSIIGMFYMFSYLVTLMPILVILANIEDKKTPLSILNGIAKNNQVVAFCLSVAFLSLAGIPIFIGFAAKALIFANLMVASSMFLVFVMIIPIVIALYAYFNIIKNMYFEKVSHIRVNLNISEKLVVYFCTLINLFGIFFIPQIIKLLKL